MAGTGRQKCEKNTILVVIIDTNGRDSGPCMVRSGRRATGGPGARREGAFARGCRHCRVTVPSSDAIERATPPSPFACSNQRIRRIGTPQKHPAGVASPAVSHTPCTWRDRWRSVPQQGVDPVRMRSGHLRVVSRKASEVPARIHCRTGIRYARC